MLSFQFGSEEEKKQANNAYEDAQNEVILPAAAAMIYALISIQHLTHRWSHVWLDL